MFGISMRFSVVRDGWSVAPKRHGGSQPVYSRSDRGSAARPCALRYAPTPQRFRFSGCAFEPASVGLTTTCPLLPDFPGPQRHRRENIWIGSFQRLVHGCRAVEPTLRQTGRFAPGRARFVLCAARWSQRLAEMLCPTGHPPFRNGTMAGFQVIAVVVASMVQQA